MSDYKIYILDHSRHIIDAHDFRGRDDLAALDESRRHSDKSAIEIWEQSRIVARIEQGGEATRG